MIASVTIAPEPPGALLSVIPATALDGLVPLVALGAARSGDLFRELAPWLVGLVVVAVIGCGVLVIIRRMLQRNEGTSEGFTLESLRRLHRDGELSDEEFERARETILDGARAAAARHRAELAAKRGAALGPELGPELGPKLGPERAAHDRSTDIVWPDGDAQNDR